jgi:integrase
VPKRRFQQGCLRIVGDQWVLYFYRDEIRDGIRQRVKVSKRIGHMALSKRQARKLAQPIMDEANNQSEIPVREIKNGMTLAEYIPEFRRVGMTDLKPSTRRSMESSIRAHLIPVLGDVSLSTIDTGKVQDLINSMMENARGTRENVVADLLFIMEEAGKGHVVPTIRKRDLKYGLKKPGEGKPFFFTPAQEKKILKAFAGRKPWDAFFTLVAMSGLRASEIIGLRVEDLDFEQNIIHVRQAIVLGEVGTTKTDGSENSIPMTPLVREKLQAHLANHTHELVFANSRRHHYSRDKIVSKVLHPVLDKLAISRKGRRVGLHAFRHTLTSMLLQSTGVAVAQRQMRHSDASTTLGHYGHVLGNDHREAIEAIESVLVESGRSE